MKATGIVRRIDDLGRIVIPKELRRTLRIREGAQLEIFTDAQENVIFRKYSPLGEIPGCAAEFAEALWKVSGVPAAICDLDCVVAAAGTAWREYAGHPVSRELIEPLGERRPFCASGTVALCDAGGDIGCAAPLIVNSDLVGAVVLANEDTPEREKFCALTALLLASSLE